MFDRRFLQNARELTNHERETLFILKAPWVYQNSFQEIYLKQGEVS